MPTTGSGVHKYATVAERLRAGMLHLPSGAWRDSITLHLWDREVYSADDWTRLLDLLGMRSRTWMWVGWSSSRDEAEELTTLVSALGDPLEHLTVPTSSRVDVAMWRCQTPVLTRLVDEVGPPALLCPANGPGWILWCDFDEVDHVHLFVEPGSSCASGDR